MRRFKIYVVLLASFISCQPCITLAAPVQVRPLHPHQRVYLLRGFLNIFSLGMDQLAAELRQRGVEAVVANHTLSGIYANEAIRDCRAGRISSIAIIGHSLGAGAGVGMADQLAQAGVKVALVVTVDPVTATAVPANVRTLKNFYFSDGVGQTVRRANNFHGSLQNIDMRADPSEGHISLANSARLHREVLGYVRAAAGSRCQ